MRLCYIHVRHREGWSITHDGEGEGSRRGSEKWPVSSGEIYGKRSGDRRQDHAMRAASRRQPGWTAAATAAAPKTRSSPDHTINMQESLGAQAILVVSASSRGDTDM